MITDHHNKYNNEKAWNIVRITKMWHRDTKWTNAVGKNGAERLGQCTAATNLQLVKKSTISVKHNKVKSNKMRYIYMKYGDIYNKIVHLFIKKGWRSPPVGG